MERTGKLAIAALGLGIVGLFTAGGAGIGSLLGLALAGAALMRNSSAGRDVAWAAVAANVFALLTALPVGAAVWAARAFPVPVMEEVPFLNEDHSLPEPARTPLAFVDPPPPPAPPTTPKEPVRVGGGIAEPAKLRHVPPVYPPEAIQARIQGVVILECTISAEGEVVRVDVRRGVALLNEPAIEAVKQWRYAPTILNGVPVPVKMTVTVNFKLS
jgi:TonB family protein